MPQYSVQHGSATIPANDQDVTVTLPDPVPEEHTFILHSMRADGRQIPTFARTIHTISNGNIESFVLDRDSDPDIEAHYEWHVITGDSLHVQKITPAFTAIGAERTIDEVDLKRTFLVPNWSTTTNAGFYTYLRAQFLDSETVEIRRALPLGTIRATIYVVESDFDVQAGNVAMEDDEETATIATIDPNQSFVIHSHYVNAQGSANLGVMGAITDSETVTFSRVGTTETAHIAYFVVSSPEITSQRGTVRMPGASATVSIDTVDTDVAFLPRPMYANTKEGSISTTFEKRILHTYKFTAADEIEIERNDLGGEPDSHWQVVELEEEPEERAVTSYMNTLRSLPQRLATTGRDTTSFLHPIKSRAVKLADRVSTVKSYIDTVQSKTVTAASMTRSATSVVSRFVSHTASVIGLQKKVTNAVHAAHSQAQRIAGKVHRPRSFLGTIRSHVTRIIPVPLQVVRSFLGSIQSRVAYPAYNIADIELIRTDEGFVSEGQRIAKIDVSSGKGAPLATSRIVWDAILPEGTDLTIEISYDGNIWHEVADGDSLPALLKGQEFPSDKIFVRQTLSTQKPEVSPELDRFFLRVCFVMVHILRTVRSVLSTLRTRAERIADVAVFVVSYLQTVASEARRATAITVPVFSFLDRTVSVSRALREKVEAVASFVARFLSRVALQLITRARSVVDTLRSSQVRTIKSKLYVPRSIVRGIVSRAILQPVVQAANYMRGIVLRTLRFVDATVPITMVMNTIRSQARRLAFILRHVASHVVRSVTDPRRIVTKVTVVASYVRRIASEALLPLLERVVRSHVGRLFSQATRREARGTAAVLSIVPALITRVRSIAETVRAVASHLVPIRSVAEKLAVILRTAVSYVATIPSRIERMGAGVRDVQNGIRRIVSEAVGFQIRQVASFLRAVVSEVQRIAIVRRVAVSVVRRIVSRSRRTIEIIKAILLKAKQRITLHFRGKHKDEEMKGKHDTDIDLKGDP